MDGIYSPPEIWSVERCLENRARYWFSEYSQPRIIRHKNTWNFCDNLEGWLNKRGHLTLSGNEEYPGDTEELSESNWLKEVEFSEADYVKSMEIP